MPQSINREEKKFLDLKFNDINDKLDTTSKQFNEILADNNLIKTKFEQLELSHSNSITLSQEKIFSKITNRRSRSCNFV